MATMTANEVSKNLWIVNRSPDVNAALLAYFPPDFVRSFVPDETWGGANLVYLAFICQLNNPNNAKTMIKYFFDNGASLDDVVSSPPPNIQYTLLGRCVQKGYFDLTKFLLDLGAKKFVCDLNYGFSLKCLFLVDRAGLIDKKMRDSFAFVKDTPTLLPYLNDRKNRYNAAIGLLAFSKHYKHDFIDKNLFVEMAKYLWEGRM